MCSIFGALSPHSDVKKSHPLRALLAQQDPDRFATFTNNQEVYLAHNRFHITGWENLSNQLVQDHTGATIVFHGKIYNYTDLKATEFPHYTFQSNLDAEIILALYEKHGLDCVQYLRGMFSFIIWDERRKKLICARDRVGVKPLYFISQPGILAFASEIKALLPFLKHIQTNTEVLGEYLTFQYTLGPETLFRDIQQLMPGHLLEWQNNRVNIKKYWDVSYRIDFDHSQKYFEEKLYDLLQASIQEHQRGSAPVGSYLSGGIDSSLVTSLAVQSNSHFYGAFHGRFADHPGYDESPYAQVTAQKLGIPLYTIDISAQNFSDNITQIIHHLETPVAGPGAFAQYMVSKLASQHVRTILAGQGGDELFGGYARYVIAYFEQTIKAAIDGSYKNGDFVVTPESIIPNLTLLQEYKPLIQKFWREGLFGPLDERYLRLIDRSVGADREIHWELFNKESLRERFKSIFNNPNNVPQAAYFDKMTHFDFKCLLPALLHVEDRMSMAHGLESRVPFLDHPLIEFAATIPADIKFPGGKMKSLLKQVFKEHIPEKILNRRDKMGFPVPLKEWFSGALREFIYDVFSSQVAQTRGYYNPREVLKNLSNSSQFSRGIWGLLCLELWHREFHDQAYKYCK